MDQGSKPSGPEEDVAEPERIEAPDEAVEQIADRIGQRAGNLFSTRQLLCAEAILEVLNEGLGGGLPGDLAVRLASGLPMGIGDRGCLCGALSGGVLALGLFLTSERPGTRSRRRARDASAELHDWFQQRYGATCCRTLTRKIKDDRASHFAQCAEITAAAASMAARIILKRRPELIGRANREFLAQKDTKVTGLIKRAFKRR